MTEQIPIVDYLVLEDDAHLVATECTTCGARYFERRNACGACYADDLGSVDIATTGELRTFTGARQIEGAKVGLAHVIGLGSACGVHILEKSAA